MKIFTYIFNNPEYLEYQIQALNKFCIDPFELICIDNAIDKNISYKFKNICVKYNIRHEINGNPDHSLPGRSHYSALQWSFNNFMSNENDLALMLDHDTFPICKFSAYDILDGNDIAGVSQSIKNINYSRPYYLHPSCIILNLANLPNKKNINFNGETVEGVRVDIGGQLAVYLKDNPSVKVKHLKYKSINKDYFNENKESNILKINPDFEFNDPFDFFESTFLHTRIGSNWSNMEKEYLKRRNNYIHSILKEKLNE